MLSLSDVALLKSELRSKYNVELHYHDVCPKPYFELERADGKITQSIAEFLAEKNQKPSFSDDGLRFTAERG